MKRTYRIRRFVAVIVATIGLGAIIFTHPDLQQPMAPQATENQAASEAQTALDTLEVKGRAPKTGYERSQFGDGWASSGGCDTRNSILRRDLSNVAMNEKCQVVSGTLNDPYTGKVIMFTRGETSSQSVQIDHVVALSDAWQKGAQQLSYERRKELANDPLELLAVEGAANMQKSDGDAATWLPPNKPFRCQYVARQIAVKKKYSLWVTAAEKDAMVRVLVACPAQGLPK
ncbi:MAG: HNH endonuclease [Candidatus Saccharibacteria bacterium]|nr:MAG: HNH endonuclease [Candidatus Saccharibacteria bacterium]